MQPETLNKVLRFQSQSGRASSANRIDARLTGYSGAVTVNAESGHRNSAAQYGSEPSHSPASIRIERRHWTGLLEFHFFRPTGLIHAQKADEWRLMF
jgi:hypothetical protein